MYILIVVICAITMISIFTLTLIVLLISIISKRNKKAFYTASTNLQDNSIAPKLEPVYEELEGQNHNINIFRNDAYAI